MSGYNIVKYYSLDSDSENEEEYLKVYELFHLLMKDPKFVPHINSVVEPEVLEDIEINLKESPYGDIKLYSYRDFEQISPALYEMIEETLDFLTKALFNKIKPYINDYIKGLFLSYLGL